MKITSSVKKTSSIKNKKRIAIIMGSLTDYKVLKEAEDILKEFQIGFHTEVVSAHRTPEKMVEFAKSARKNGFQVIIAGAGGAAHLPGMVASLTTLPVVGVPITTTSLKGLDALLSIAQMPAGVPVATMAVDNAKNAALMALRILAANEESFSKSIEKKLTQFMDSQKTKIKKMNQQMKKAKRREY